MAFVEDVSGKITSDKSIAITLLMNIAVLLSAIHFGWDVFTLMLLYWFETAIIGLFTVVKLIHTAKWISIGIVPFFCFHFGMFMFVHLTFLFVMFGGDTELADLDTFSKVVTAFSIITIPAAGLFGSHLYSFFVNYIGKKEYQTKTFMHFFAYPYPRVIVMHLTIIFGGFLSMVLSPVFSLILLSILKTWSDVASHIKMHKPKVQTNP